jgi:hypothetical protein
MLDWIGNKRIDYAQFKNFLTLKGVEKLSEYLPPAAREEFSIALKESVKEGSELLDLFRDKGLFSLEKARFAVLKGGVEYYKSMYKGELLILGDSIRAHRSYLNRCVRHYSE